VSLSEGVLALVVLVARQFAVSWSAHRWKSVECV
jgi:hypothetical protein